jgi:lipopolysaccharide export system protein LptA
MNFQRSKLNPLRSTQLCGARWLAGALLLLIGVGSGLGQANLPGVVTGYNATRYYPAPNFRQMEMKLTGAEAMQLPGAAKQFRIIKPVFVSFEPTGATQVTIETPECIFDETDSKARRVSSTETLAMRTGDGRFSIVGKGFLWRQEEKILIISNDVRAVVHWTNNAPPLEITSRWFEFDAGRGRGIFHDDVRGENPDLVFICALLTVSGSMDKTNRSALNLSGSGRGTFELIEADGGLEITWKTPGRYAKAQRGLYRHAEQRVDLVGAAEWGFDGRAGRADRITAWTNAENVEAVGQVVVSMPQSALGAAGGLLSSTNAPTKTSGTNLVTLFTDRFTKRGDRLLAEGAVRVNDGTNQLTCDRLEAKQATPQSPEEFAAATGNVFVGRAGGGIHSDRADYTKANNQVLFTGNPRFVQGEVRGTAGRVIVRTLTSEVLAEDDVEVTFPLASGSGTFLDFLPEETTNRVAQTKTKPPDQKVRMTARTFRLQDRLALFAGNVEAHQLPADGSEPRMRCGELEVRIAADGRQAESLQARQNVVCERGVIGVTNGPAERIYTRMDCETLTANANPASGDLEDLVAGGGVQLQRVGVTANGDKAVYTRADQLLKLLGNAVVESPEMIYKGRVLTYNIVTEQVVGNYDSVRSNPGFLNELEKSKKLP